MKRALQQAGPALLSAVLLAVAFPTWDLFFLAWIGLVPLLWRCWNASPKRAVVEFLACGWLVHLLVLRWVLVQVFWAGGWVILGYVAMAFMYGLFWAGAGFLWRLSSRNSGPAVSAALFALIWATMELVEALPFNVFGAPVSLAYSQGKNLALLQWAAIGGVPLVGLFLAMTNGLIASALIERKGRILRLVACLGVAVVSRGGVFLLDDPDSPDDPFVVGIFQSDFPIEMKHDSEYGGEMVRNAAEKSRVLAENVALDLMVWPEALVMSSMGSREVQELVLGFTSETGVPLFTGSARRGGDPVRAYNSAYMVGVDGTISEPYDKIQLAPFGEYIPLAGLFSFVPALVPVVGQMASGEEPVVFDVGERRLGPLICFEMMFPAMAERLRDEGADFLVVVTNLAWFGASNALSHEFEVSRLRAIETRLPLVHAANTGISGVFDPFGRFTAMDSVVDQFGNYGRLPEGMDPRRTIQHRLTGAFEVPPAASRPLPLNPQWVAWLAPLIAVLIAVLVATGARVFNRDGSAA